MRLLNFGWWNSNTNTTRNQHKNLLRLNLTKVVQPPVVHRCSSSAVQGLCDVCLLDFNCWNIFFLKLKFSFSNKCFLSQTNVFSLKHTYLRAVTDKIKTHDIRFMKQRQIAFQKECIHNSGTNNNVLVSRKQLQISRDGSRSFIWAPAMLTHVSTNWLQMRGAQLLLAIMIDGMMLHCNWLHHCATNTTCCSNWLRHCTTNTTCCSKWLHCATNTTCYESSTMHCIVHCNVLWCIYNIHLCSSYFMIYSIIWYFFALLHLHQQPTKNSLINEILFSLLNIVIDGIMGKLVKIGVNL